MARRVLLIAALLAGCGSEDRAKPPPPAPVDAAPLRPEDQFTRAIGDEVEKAVAERSWELALAHYSELPADSETRVRLKDAYQAARAGYLPDRERASQDAHDSHYCVGAYRVARHVHELMPGDEGPFFERARSCRGAPGAGPVTDYADAEWSRVDAPGDLIYFLESGAQRDPELDARTLDVYAAVILQEPAMAILLVAAPPDGTPGPIEENGAAAVSRALVDRGVDPSRIRVEIRAKPYSRVYSSVGLTLMSVRPR